MGQRVKMGFCYLPPEKSKWGLLLITPWHSQTNSEQQERNKRQGQNGQRVKMGQGSHWASVIYPQPLKESKWGKDHYGLLLFTPWQSETCSEQEEINKQQGQNGQRVTEMGFCYFPLKESKWGCCCLPPDRVKLMVNSKKKTNSRV